MCQDRCAKDVTSSDLSAFPPSSLRSRVRPRSRRRRRWHTDRGRTSTSRVRPRARERARRRCHADRLAPAPHNSRASPRMPARGGCNSRRSRDHSRRRPVNQVSTGWQKCGCDGEMRGSRAPGAGPSSTTNSANSPIKPFATQPLGFIICSRLSRLPSPPNRLGRRRQRT
jgi:hypothetical protein